jgi:hypothetical protein
VQTKYLVGEIKAGLKINGSRISKQTSKKMVNFVQGRSMWSAVVKMVISLQVSER